MKEYMKRIQEGEKFSQDQMLDIFTHILEGKAAEQDIAGFLMGLSERGETADEITGAARVLRSMAETIKAPEGTVDCCGTGGDNRDTYNISTAVALVAAACGVPVAKHGNRASTSKSGAADVLEHLGVNLNMPKQAVEVALENIHFAFLMAPNHHKAMKNVAPIRRKLKSKTIFNLLGPLANPAGAKLQLVGVYDDKWLLPMAHALKNLGSIRAWVVHGDGLDEITTTGPTSVAILENGVITMRELNPRDFGLPSTTINKLVGGDAKHNAAALRKLLNGEQSAYRDIVLANTAAVLNIHGTVKSLKEGVAMAAEAIDSMRAERTLQEYVTLSRKFQTQ